MATISQTSIHHEIDRIHNLQLGNLQNLKLSSFADRIKKLDKLNKFLRSKDNEQKLCNALYKDLKRAHGATVLFELIPTLSHISYVRKNLKSWMRPKSTNRSLFMVGLNAKIMLEPKGQSLIIAPWNLPFYLAVYPIIYAIAAGCSVILKPSEYSPNTSIFLQDMLDELFDEKEVNVIQGELETSQALLAKKWDHIYFTGSTQVGKIVMMAAAKNLSSITLELGGKNACIIEESANLKKAARKLLWGKFSNAGQTCVAPDQVYVHKSIKDEFTKICQELIKEKYGQDPQDSPDLARIISKKHFTRIVGIIEDSVNKGANILHGGKHDASDLYIAPTIIEGTTEDMLIQKEEIFGPIIPLIAFSKKEEIVAQLKNKEKSLAMYVFSKNKKNIKYYQSHTSSGSFLVNDYFMNAAFPEVPFGGVNHSGLGKSYGYHGFVEFSNEKPVLHRRFLGFYFLFPPYTKLVNTIIQIYKRIV